MRDLRTLSSFSMLAASFFSRAAVAFQPRPMLQSTSNRLASSSSSSTLRASALEELSTMTTLSVDTGDLDQIEKYGKTGLITDATTNPLLVSQAALNGDKRYQDMVSDAITYAKRTLGGGDTDLPDPEAEMNLTIDKLAVNLGTEITKLVPGRVSTEVDIRLSYDTEASVQRARRIIQLYKEMGVDKSRILIKLAGTWEGIQAAAILEKKHGINCNITLIFSMLQAAAAAQAQAYLISPFPGRILDWHKSKSGKSSYHPTADPGVLAVKQMYGYLKKYDYSTICMPSSWRPSRGADVDGSQVDEILALAGVDEMTIPPPLLEALASMDASAVERECNAESDGATCVFPNFPLTKETYEAYWDVDQCGKDKLAEGIEIFTAETNKLKELLVPQFA